MGWGIRVKAYILLALLCGLWIGAAQAEELWGHLRYREGGGLRSALHIYPPRVTPPAFACRLNAEVLAPLGALLAAASAQGHTLIARSCYRSVDYQVDVFFFPAGRSPLEEPRQVRERALQSAPPGFSEHHTGYAIDFCDGATPQTCDDLQPNFAGTAAGKWLIAHGADYGFEMSFPMQDDPCIARSGRPAQGVGYEPWHWRYVGSGAARKIFATARTRFALCPVPARAIAPATLTAWREADWLRRANALWQGFTARIEKSMR